eukprot:7322466-Karenia_brevis.AAC.1
MHTLCNKCRRCNKCVKRQHANFLNDKCQRHQRCEACQYKKHHGIDLSKEMARIMQEFGAYEKYAKVIGQKANQETPTRGTAGPQKWGS